MHGTDIVFTFGYPKGRFCLPPRTRYVDDVRDVLSLHANARGGRNQSKTLEAASFRGHELETPPTNSTFEAPSLRGHQLDTLRAPPLPSPLFCFACARIGRCSWRKSEHSPAMPRAPYSRPFHPSRPFAVEPPLVVCAGA